MVVHSTPHGLPHAYLHSVAAMHCVPALQFDAAMHEEVRRWAPNTPSPNSNTAVGWSRYGGGASAPPHDRRCIGAPIIALTVKNSALFM